MLKTELNFEGMTQEQVNLFIDSVDISVEVTAYCKLALGKNGYIQELKPTDETDTGWLTGEVLNQPLHNNIGISGPDLLDAALKLFKKHNFDIDAAGEELAESYVLT